MDACSVRPQDYRWMFASHLAHRWKRLSTNRHECEWHNHRLIFASQLRKDRRFETCSTEAQMQMQSRGTTKRLEGCHTMTSGLFEESFLVVSEGWFLDLIVNGEVKFLIREQPQPLSLTANLVDEGDVGLGGRGRRCRTGST